jgi:hypothetical protein
MALEDAVARLASAIERSQSNAVVAEIIRQRDQWQKLAEERGRRGDMYQSWYHDKSVANQRLGRVIAALRGTITRMKRKAATGGE